MVQGIGAVCGCLGMIKKAKSPVLAGAFGFKMGRGSSFGVG